MQRPPLRTSHSDNAFSLERGHNNRVVLSAESVLIHPERWCKQHHIVVQPTPDQQHKAISFDASHSRQQRVIIEAPTMLHAKAPYQRAGDTCVEAPQHCMFRIEMT